MGSRDLLPDHPAELELFDYLVGHLPPDVSDRVRRHVSVCRACRRTLADLSLSVDELDRLPTAATPHDAVDDGGRSRGRRRIARILPGALLLAAVLAVAATLRLGGQPAGREASPNRVVVRADGADGAIVVQRILSGVPATVVRNRDDDFHLVAMVADDDVGPAMARLAGAATGGDFEYRVDVAGVGDVVPSVDVVPTAVSGADG